MRAQKWAIVVLLFVAVMLAAPAQLPSFAVANDEMGRSAQDALRMEPAASPDLLAPAAADPAPAGNYVITLKGVGQSLRADFNDVRLWVEDAEGNQIYSAT